jgi:hypothetical protein
MKKLPLAIITLAFLGGAGEPSYAANYFKSPGRWLKETGPAINRAAIHLNKEANKVVIKTKKEINNAGVAINKGAIHLERQIEKHPEIVAIALAVAMGGADWFSRTGTESTAVLPHIPKDIGSGHADSLKKLFDHPKSEAKPQAKVQPQTTAEHGETKTEVSPYKHIEPTNGLTSSQASKGAPSAPLPTGGVSAGAPVANQPQSLVFVPNYNPSTSKIFVNDDTSGKLWGDEVASYLMSKLPVEYRLGLDGLKAEYHAAVYLTHEFAWQTSWGVWWALSTGQFNGSLNWGPNPYAERDLKALAMDSKKISRELGELVLGKIPQWRLPDGSKLPKIPKDPPASIDHPYVQAAPQDPRYRSL